MNDMSLLMDVVSYEYSFKTFAYSSDIHLKRKSTI